MEVAYSVNGVPIRLTDERWGHIIAARDDMAAYYDDCLNVVENPDMVLAGRHGSLKAVKNYGANRYMIVIYREVSRNDGFVITAYFVRRVPGEKVIWRR